MATVNMTTICLHVKVYMSRSHLDNRCDLDNNRRVPSKNIVKSYIENGYYHIYNRGVEKREIFLDEQDCFMFIYYLKMYLSPPEELMQLKQPGLRLDRYISHNLYTELELLSFALMPNHIHLLIKQYSKNGIVKLMRRLSTAYVMYFNKKYDRVGALFQNRYKGILITTDNYLLHISRYIHLNPRNIQSSINFHKFTSYDYYLSSKKASWIKPDEILDCFKVAQSRDLRNMMSYKVFVEEYSKDSSQILGDLTLEND